MSLTTDPNHPDLLKGSVDEVEREQNSVYLVLSQEERDKGFVRPVRRSYIHVGLKPKYPLRDLTAEEIELYGEYNYVKFEPYPNDGSAVTGCFWTQKRLDTKGCGTLTTMGLELSETYARDPYFYGATYCVGCKKHLEAREFVWEDGEVVGS